MRAVAAEEAAGAQGLERLGRAREIRLGVLDDATKIRENLLSALSALSKAKPASAKGRYFLSVTLSSTMGPGVKIDPTVALKLAG